MLTMHSISPTENKPSLVTSAHQENREVVGFSILLWHQINDCLLYLVEYHGIA